MPASIHNQRCFPVIRTLHTMAHCVLANVANINFVEMVRRLSHDIVSEPQRSYYTLSHVEESNTEPGPLSVPCLARRHALLCLQFNLIY